MENKMPHSFSTSYYHCVFSTKDRRKLITNSLESRLFSYIGGIARVHKITLIEIGGMPDHVHLLLSLPATMPISKAIQLIKGGSSKWIHDTFQNHRSFSWQPGYGAFSIGTGDIERTRKYIRNQKIHHRNRDFKREYLAILEKNGLEYEDRHVF